MWYHETNVGGTIKLCQLMAKFGVKNLVFSSSATVYSDARNSPLPEVTPTVATNPYGQAKLMTEWVLQDLHQSDNSRNIAVLRHFNPVSDDATGNIGEDPNGIPNNLMPFIMQVAVGKRAQLQIFGKDYQTADGAGSGVDVFNLDSGEGLSVWM